MWARLKQVGWTWKQGSGLHPYSYFRPGANTSLRKGALEGRDYFSPEAAVSEPSGWTPLHFAAGESEREPRGTVAQRG